MVSDSVKRNFGNCTELNRHALKGMCRGRLEQAPADFVVLAGGMVVDLAPYPCRRGRHSGTTLGPAASGKGSPLEAPVGQQEASLAAGGQCRHTLACTLVAQGVLADILAVVLALALVLVLVPPQSFGKLRRQNAPHRIDRSASCSDRGCISSYQCV